MDRDDDQDELDRAWMRYVLARDGLLLRRAWREQDSQDDRRSTATGTAS